MDVGKRDYDQHSFETALQELADDPRARDVDVIKALVVQLCLKLAPDDDEEHDVARQQVRWIVKALLLSTKPVWRDLPPPNTSAK
jgi:hypothetical protein